MVVRYNIVVSHIDKVSTSQTSYPQHLKLKIRDKYTRGGEGLYASLILQRRIAASQLPHNEHRIGEDSGKVTALVAGVDDKDAYYFDHVHI